MQEHQAEQAKPTIPPTRYLVQVTGVCASFFDGHKPIRKTLFLEQYASGCFFTRMREAQENAQKYCFGFQNFIQEKTKFKVFEWSEALIEKFKNSRKEFKLIRSKPNTLPKKDFLKNAVIIEI